MPPERIVLSVEKDNWDHLVWLKRALKIARLNEVDAFDTEQIADISDLLDEMAETVTALWVTAIRINQERMNP